MTLGIFLPVVLLVVAAYETVIFSRLMKKESASDPTAPPDPAASRKKSGLKLLLISAWTMPVALYVILNVVTDIGTTKIF